MTRIGVDVGGTFTDIVALDRNGGLKVAKVPSTAGRVASAVWQAVTRLGGDAGAPSLVHGTTVATNALLERAGARVVLLATAGFEDLLWLRRQDRASLYELHLDHPPPPVARDDVIGVVERIGAGGVVTPLTQDEVRRVVTAVRARSPGAVAISLLFSFRDPSHERRLADALRAALPETPVVASSEVLPVFREYERTGTVAAEAYLRPLVGRYLRAMATETVRIGVQDLRIMASNGGTLNAAQAETRAAWLALSGPAGGVEGARLVGEELGFRDLLTLDMGGTSADASVLLGGAPLTQSGGAVGGVPLALPRVLIETVGAGGGSIAWVDAGGALRVGPRSAGADPGPACYGLGGGEATVTDAALVLGWLDREHPLAESLRLDPAPAERAVATLARRLDLDARRCAEGIVEIANATMVRALRRVSVERGVDPRAMTLVAFGGAGPLFACRLADGLGTQRAVVPPHAGALSALGLAAAPPRIEVTASLHRSAGDLPCTAVNEVFHPLERAALDQLPGASITRVAECRYPGQGYELDVVMGADGPATAAAFHRIHQERHGHANPTGAVEIVNVRLVATGEATDVRLGARPLPEMASPSPVRPARRARFESLAPGEMVDGPFTLDAPESTTRIEPGWRGTMHPTGALILTRESR